MSNSPSEPSETEAGISDEQLPEDLQPTDDNPLAKAPDEDDAPALKGPQVDGPDPAAVAPGD